MRRTNVVKLFKELKPSTSWVMTPRRKIAIERNWCYRILAAIEGLTEGPLLRFGVSQAVRQQLLNAVRAARYSVDNAYYDKIEELERKGK